MRVDYTQWYVDQPKLVARQYKFSQMDDTPDFTFEIRFMLDLGLGVYTHIVMMMSLLGIEEETRAVLRILTKPRTQPIFVEVVAEPDGSGGAVLRVVEREQSMNCVKAFEAARDMEIECLAENGETQFQLLFPNDGEFKAHYDSCYSQMIEQLQKEQKIAGGFWERAQNYLKDRYP